MCTDQESNYDSSYSSKNDNIFANKQYQNYLDDLNDDKGVPSSLAIYSVDNFPQTFHFLEDEELPPSHKQNPIPQTDGPTDLFEFCSMPSENITRESNFILNEEKQTEKIRRDALINDYEVTTKNQDENINIKCST